MAEKTGWSEHFILWELPITRLLAYEHCALATSEGLWTVKRERRAALSSAPVIPAGYFDLPGEEDE